MNDPDLWQVTFACAFYSSGITVVARQFKRGDLMLGGMFCSFAVGVGEIVMQHRGISESFPMWPIVWFWLAVLQGSWTYDLAIYEIKEVLAGRRYNKALKALLDRLDKEKAEREKEDDQ